MYNEVETGITMGYVFPRTKENRKPTSTKSFSFKAQPLLLVKLTLGRTR